MVGMDIITDFKRPQNVLLDYSSSENDIFKGISSVPYAVTPTYRFCHIFVKNLCSCIVQLGIQFCFVLKMLSVGIPSNKHFQFL